MKFESSVYEDEYVEVTRGFGKNIEIVVKTQDMPEAVMVMGLDDAYRLAMEIELLINRMEKQK